MLERIQGSRRGSGPFGSRTFPCGRRDRDLRSQWRSAHRGPALDPGEVL